MLSASWALFRDRGLSQTPLELPMTKAAVKAMDVIGEFLDVHSFVLVGASKRGNLCWHTATVDARVRGIVPIARAINLGAVWARTQRQLGGFPMVTQDYVEKHLLAGYLETPSGEPLLHIEDPFFYLERTAGLPKFIINAASDDFFIPDNTREWWDAVPEPKWLATMPNTKHISGGSQVVGLAPLISAFVKNLQLPNISWTIQEDGAIFAQTDARNPPVQRVKLWQASSCDAHRMDWRQLSAKAEVCPCGQATSQGCENWVQWNSYDLPHHSFWRVRPNISADGRWTAFFLSFEWPGGIEISTEVSVVPTNFAFPDCGGDACGGMV